MQLALCKLYNCWEVISMEQIFNQTALDREITYVVENIYPAVAHLFRGVHWKLIQNTDTPNSINNASAVYSAHSNNKTAFVSRNASGYYSVMLV